MAAADSIQKTQQPKTSAASILAVGTASPPNCIYQDDNIDFYFHATNSHHMTHLKDKFKRICNKSKVKKRYSHITEEILRENPSIATYEAPSLGARQDMLAMEVPKLGQEAALKAIKEWGQPISRITHLMFFTTSGAHLPGADFQLTKLLGLNLSVQRLMVYMSGCSAGGTALRLAKDIAENNPDARVLVVLVELFTTLLFNAPSEKHLDYLVGQALFADGAAAMIVGAHPDTKLESPIFEIVSAAQTIIPNSEDSIKGHFREMGSKYYLNKNTGSLIDSHINISLTEAFRPIGINDWNSLFFVVHPGGPAILDKIEQNLCLKEEKLRETRYVLSEYGNMGGPSVIFILNEMRKRSVEEGKATTGEGLEWGVLIGLGPGLTIETIVLQSVLIE